MNKNKQTSEGETFLYLPVDYWFDFPPFQDDDGGIVARGGNLSPGMLFSAYMQGIFPWFNEGEEPHWWSPNPRFVLLPKDFHLPKSLKRTLTKKTFEYTMNVDFEGVIRNCALAKRVGQDGTWITDEVIEAYIEFHRLGFAHSFEAWIKDGDGTSTLVGGFYGIVLGKMFCGESMFSFVKDASKCAFAHFVLCFTKSGGALIDSQVYTNHVARFGAKNVSRNAFLRLKDICLQEDLDVPLQNMY